MTHISLGKYAYELNDVESRGLIMEISKKSIHMNFERGRAQQIVTVDDDFNVPDNKPDIVKKIKETADVIVEKVRPMEERTAIGGKIRYRLLYAGGNGPSSMEGQIDFEEVIPIEGMTTQDIIKYNCNLEDITVNVINSRKISVKAVVTINICVEAQSSREAVTGLTLENLQSKGSRINVMQLITNKKDIFRIRESMNIPSDRENIGEIVWSELRIQNMDMRACDGEIAIKGELCVFCIYTADGTDEMNFYDDVIPFSGKIQAAGCTEEMLPDISAAVSEQSLIARPDANGEMRILDGELILDLDIKGYADEEYEILSDAYSPSYDLQLDKENIEYQSYLIRNSVKCRMEERFRIPEGGILQIIDSSGRINLGDIVEDGAGVTVEGSVTVDVIYIKPDDNDKIGYVQYEVPFSEKADIPAASDDCVYSCRPGALQISTLLTGGGEINIKCVTSAEITVTERHEASIIYGVKAEKPDYEKIKALPGIVGYITREDDTLWDIAKKYCTTIKNIMDINELTGQEVAPGTKLMIIKSRV